MADPDDIRNLIHSRRRALRGRHDLAFNRALSVPVTGTQEFPVAGAQEAPVAEAQEIPVLSSGAGQQRLMNFPDAASIRQRFEMSNIQSAALAGGIISTSAANSTSSDRAANLAGDLPRVSQKLDDAATKMDKAFSNARTIVLLKD
jgi:hypothetical protein